MTLSDNLSTGKIYLVNGKRTPFGKFGGSLKDISPVDLAVKATKGLLEKKKISGEDIDHFILGKQLTERGNFFKDIYYEQ